MSTKKLDYQEKTDRSSSLLAFPKQRSNLGIGKNNRLRFESFDAIANINVTEPDQHKSTSTAEENKNGSMALHYSENSERKGKDKRLIREEDEEEMANMMDQMFSAEESDRLNKLQTNYEWKRTIKRNAGNVNQFAHDMEKFN